MQDAQWSADGDDQGDARLQLAGHVSRRTERAPFSPVFRFVLHTVGPVGEGDDLLRSSYRTVLEIVKARDDIRTVALCGVSTGIFGFDLLTASRIALTEVRTWLEQNHASVDKIVFCTFLPKELAMYEKLFPLFFPVAEAQ